MSESNFGSAFLKGIKVSEVKEKSRKEIFSMIEKMAKEVKEVSNNAINIQIIKDIDFVDKDNRHISAIAELGKMARSAYDPTFRYGDLYSKISTKQPDHLNYVLVINNDERSQVKLTDFIFDPNAYPCRFKIDGSDVISNDGFSLERNLTKLLSSAYAGDCFRRLMKQ